MKYLYIASIWLAVSFVFGCLAGRFLKMSSPDKPEVYWFDGAWWVVREVEEGE